MPISPTDEYRRECISAAYASRLDPHALLRREYHLLGPSASNGKIVYLNIRNAILRLWCRNPSIEVTRDEALETAGEYRYRPFALLAHELLTRLGYINYGCLDLSQPHIKACENGHHRKRKVIAVIGAGVAGLACARHLEGLIRQFPEKWLVERQEALPRVIILEGRDRIGGRVYSHPLRGTNDSSLPGGLTSTAELGAHIITGFEHGNPLDAVIRGQLCLHYHLLTDNMILHDYDGSLVEESRDKEVQHLYDKIIEAASPYAWDYTLPGCKNGSWPGPGRKPGRPVGYKPDSKRNGFKAKSPSERKTHHSSLGSFVHQMAAYSQSNLSLSAQSMRLLNWHFADLEYAYASNISSVSLGGWDQDSGNEFEGRHSQIIGGYTQMVRGLWKHPTPLDVRTKSTVKRINYTGQPCDDQSEKTAARIECAGYSCDADYVVCTLPLGVLQHDSWSIFNPPLPKWKTAAMNRLGFGLLNKIVLVFDHIFWELDRDIFGYLNQSEKDDSNDQEEYSRDRGRCYFFWNCVKTSGRPMLIGLMAGDAALAVESTPDEDLIEEATKKLATMWHLEQRPKPVESIVTRWKSDRFARGTYSYPGRDAVPGDYEAMAKNVGNLYFAGEATSVTHPATVHGAFLSGMKAAAEVVESMIGPERLMTLA